MNPQIRIKTNEISKGIATNVPWIFLCRWVPQQCSTYHNWQKVECFLVQTTKLVSWDRIEKEYLIPTLAQDEIPHLNTLKSYEASHAE